MSILYTCLVGISIPLKKIYNLQGAASALFFRDTARQAVALLLFRDMVMRPRKGCFAFCLWSALLLWFSFCFLCSGEQQPQTRTQKKKRWGPALGLWQGLVALARAKLRKQQSKIHSHKEKKKRQFQHRTHKAANQKAACRKETTVHHSLHHKRKKRRASTLHAALTENSRP